MKLHLTNERLALLEIESMLGLHRGPLSVREVAARLRISRGAVENIEKRAMAKLQALAKPGLLP